MQVKGTVISVEIDVQVAKNGGGTYPGSRLTYRDETGSVKEKAFHNNVFKFNPVLKTQVSNLKAGEVFIMEMEKEGDFWNVKSVLPQGSVSAAPTNDTPATGKDKPYQSPKSTYETPEERAKKQVYIIRQSSITSAIAFGKAKNIKEVLDTAKQFEDYVLGSETTIVDDGSMKAMQGDEKEVF